jgi:hypothetical protein
MGWLVVGMVASAGAQTVRVTADRTNLRDKPAATGAVVSSIARGDELTVLERAGTWFKVRTANGAEGYVSSLLVEERDNGTPIAAPAAATTAAPAPAASASAAAVTAAAQTGAPEAPATGRAARLRIIGGVTGGYGDLGYLAGAGVGLRPFGHRQIEIAVDGLIGRSGESYNDASGTYDVSTTLLSGSATLLYNFNFDDVGFAPFTGLGVTIARASSSADSDQFDIAQLGYSGRSSALHASAGVEKPFGGGRGFRAEYRSTFHDYGYRGILLFGLSF